MNAGTSGSGSSDSAGNANDKTIGAQLRTAREGCEFRLEEVAEQLHLDTVIIEALERDDQAALPEPIFVQGYLRSYARLVGLPEDELVRRYSAQGPEPPPLSVIGGGARRPMFRLPSARLIRNAILIMLGAVLLWLAYPYVERLIESRNSTPQQETPGHLDLPPVFEEALPPIQAE